MTIASPGASVAGSGAMPDSSSPTELVTDTAGAT